MVKYIKYVILLTKLRRKYDLLILKKMPLIVGSFGFIYDKLYEKYLIETLILDNAIRRLKKLRSEWKEQKS